MEENNKFINKNEFKDNNVKKPKIKKIFFSTLKIIQPKERENKIKFICKKRQYFKVENKSKIKKNFPQKESKMKENGQKKKIINFWKELPYMEQNGENLKY